MKIRYVGDPLDLKNIIEDIKNKEVSFVMDSEDYILKKASQERDHLIAIKDGKYQMIPIKEAVFIESYDHQVLLHTIKETYLLEEKLYEIEHVFQTKGFIRIAKSYIVHKPFIKTIIPDFNRKFTLVLKTGETLTVTRHYYQTFKQAIGMKVKSK